MKLEIAQKMVSTALAHAREQKFKPLVVVVMDERGAMRAVAAEDGTSLRRADIAIGKANGAISLGTGSRGLAQRAEKSPQFISAAGQAIGGLVPVPGGVLVRDGNGEIVGVIGISGDTSDNDEACAVAAIASVGLKADTG
ncbi:MAG TPA: heme-binding protein [Polyangiaceae bacterium]|jgi:uncharacterized protein GlcG (DUF336 family)